MSFTLSESIPMPREGFVTLQVWNPFPSQTTAVEPPVEQAFAKNNVKIDQHINVLPIVENLDQKDPEGGMKVL